MVILNHWETIAADLRQLSDDAVFVLWYAATIHRNSFNPHTELGLAKEEYNFGADELARMRAHAEHLVNLTAQYVHVLPCISHISYFLASEPVQTVRQGSNKSPKSGTTTQ